MGNIFINPGAGPCTEGTFEHAERNIRQFIKDCQVKLHVTEYKTEPAGGRYLFVLEADDNPDVRFEVEIPGLPLEQVRYMGEKGQNIWDFPRLYVNGSSWVWKYALIKELPQEN